MKKRVYSFLGAFLVVVLSGCATTQMPVEDAPPPAPLNNIQQEFYDVQTLFEAEKYAATIELGETFLGKYKRDLLAVAIKYYVGVSYQRQHDAESAKRMFNDIRDAHTDDAWGRLALVGLQELEDGIK